MKTKMWISCTEPVMSYGAQTWALTKTETQRLQTTQRSMDRSIIGIRKKEKTRSEDIRKRTMMVDTGYKTKKLKWKYAGHTARLKPVRWGNKVEVWTPHESKRLEAGR